jgi:hypothetical protein
MAGKRQQVNDQPDAVDLLRSGTWSIEQVALLLDSETVLVKRWWMGKPEILQLSVEQSTSCYVLVKMGLGAGKKSHLSDQSAPIADTADIKAADLSSQVFDCESIMNLCSAFCHTFPPKTSLNLEGGEGGTRAKRANLLNTFGRTKFMSIALADPPLPPLPPLQARAQRFASQPQAPQTQGTCFSSTTSSKAAVMERRPAHEH